LEKVSSKGAAGFAKASEAFDNSVFRLKSLPSMESKTTQVAAFDGRGIMTPHKLTTTDLGRTPVDSNLLNGVVTAVTSGNSPVPMLSDAGLWSAPETDGF
jgi:hypothetical protein